MHKNLIGGPTVLSFGI